MNLATLFKNFHLEKVKLNLRVAEAEFSFQETDRDAAWELYVEMLTRIVTQPLPAGVGDEQTALDSVYSLFPTTREILRRRGQGATEFSKVAIPVLNQVVRPFTAKWHRESLAGAFDDEAKRKEFREELESLQEELRNYNRMLAEVQRHKVFISFHHEDQKYKDQLVRAMDDGLVDKSVEDGDIDDTHLKTQTIRQKIRDGFIADATVTVVLIGPCTWQRKHVDWEIGSSLRHTKNNSRCGLLGILLPDHPDFGKRDTILV